jgi:hypothetical protein
MNFRQLSHELAQDMRGSRPRPIADVYLNEADIQRHRDNVALARRTSIADRQKIQFWLKVKVTNRPSRDCHSNSANDWSSCKQPSKTPFIVNPTDGYQPNDATFLTTFFNIGLR